MQYIPIMKQYSVIKWNKLQIHTTLEVNLKNFILSEKSTQEFPLYKFLEQGRLICGGKNLSRAPCERRGQGLTGNRTLLGMEVIFYIFTGIFTSYIFLFLQHVLLKTHRMVNIRFVYFLLCKFYLKRKNLQILSSS